MTATASSTTFALGEAVVAELVDGEEAGDEVVTGVGDALCDEVGEVAAHRAPVEGVLGVEAVHRPGEIVGPRLEHVSVGLGHGHEVGDDGDRQGVGEVLDEVDLPRGHAGPVEEPVDRCFELIGHRGDDVLDSRAVASDHRVERRVQRSADDAVVRSILIDLAER